MPPEALARLESLVSPYVGVVRGVEEVLAAPEDVRLVNVFCESAHGAALVGAAVAHTGGGSGESREEARAAALGEAVERYSASYADEGALVVASARELGPRAVAPERFALFHDAQYAAPGFPYARFDRDTRLAWVEGVSLPGGEPAWLPAQLVHLTAGRDEPRICRATSNGLACHGSFPEAVLAGLLELLERDAFMITWNARLSWPRLAWPAGGRLGEFARRYVEPAGLQTAAIDLSAVWEVPCVLGVARSGAPREAPLGVGAAAAPAVERAVAKALDEAIRVRSWASALRRLDPTGAGAPSPGEIRDFEQHIRYYAHDGNAARTAFLDASPRRRDAAGVPGLEGATAAAQVEAVCTRLERRGASAYAVDVTAPDVRDAGLTVVRTVAPELCALDVEHGARLLGGRRLYEEPARLGLRARPLEPAEVNPDPHPFP